eukprot:8776053-Pyramimonas_sp.AAC.1
MVRTLACLGLGKPKTAREARSPRDGPRKEAPKRAQDGPKQDDPRRAPKRENPRTALKLSLIHI